MAEEIEPLESGLWLRRIGMIANGELGSIENSLRHAAHLAQLAPRAFRKDVGLANNEHAFEALLESGEFDAAALFLLPSAFNVERDANGVSRAATKCALLNRTFYCNSETIADAVLGAWTACLLALAAEFLSIR